MDETQYTISEAGKMVGVESHVLRYWEDELKLEIPRNGKGHRYYTELHIRLFQKIKELKEKGYQLKAIEHVLKGMLDGEVKNPDEILEQTAVRLLKEDGVRENGSMSGAWRDKEREHSERAEAEEVMQDGNEEDGCYGEEDRAVQAIAKQSKDGIAAVDPDKLVQFQKLMNHIIGNAIGQAMSKNREILTEEISRQVSDHMVQEMEYMLRVSDEKEEERFKQLDDTLRAFQRENKGKAEAAATKLPFFKRKRFGRSGKKM